MILKLPQRLDQAFLEKLESKRKKLEAVVPVPRDFVIPGNTIAAAYLDFARTITRRSERKVVGLVNEKAIQNEVLIIWLNRLSDYLYLLARYEEKVPLMLRDKK